MRWLLNTAGPTVMKRIGVGKAMGGLIDTLTDANIEELASLGFVTGEQAKLMKEARCGRPEPTERNNESGERLEPRGDEIFGEA